MRREEHPRRSPDGASSLPPAATRALTLTAVLLALAAGCAPLPPPATTPAPSSRVARGTPVPVDTAQSPVPAPAVTPPPAPAAARVDSGPSPEAIEVLRSIAEPVPGAPSSEAAPADTSGAVPTGGIPVPSPTEPLGERPGDQGATAADTTAAQADTTGQVSPSGPAPPARFGSPPQAAPGAGQPAPATPVNPDSCWRVQVAAPLDTTEAEQMRSAAQSVLLIPMVIEDEAGRHKVRNRDCLDRENAERLKQRAVESGFDGAFLVRGGKR